MELNNLELMKNLSVINLNNKDTIRLFSIDVYAQRDLCNRFHSTEVYKTSNFRKGLIGDKKNSEYINLFNQSICEEKRQKIFRLLYDVGVPDLVYFKKDSNRTTLFFFEVKSHNDNLRLEQLNWMKKADEHGLKVYILSYPNVKIKRNKIKRKLKFKNELITGDKINTIPKKMYNKLKEYEDIIDFQNNTINSLRKNLILKENQLIRKEYELEEMNKILSNIANKSKGDGESHSHVIKSDK